MEYEDILKVCDIQTFKLSINYSCHLIAYLFHCPQCISAWCGSTCVSSPSLYLELCGTQYVCLIGGAYQRYHQGWLKYIIKVCWINQHMFQCVYCQSMPLIQIYKSDWYQKYSRPLREVVEFPEDSYFCSSLWGHWGERGHLKLQYKTA